TTRKIAIIRSSAFPGRSWQGAFLVFWRVSVSTPDLTTLMARAERVLTQLEAWLPPAPPPTDWSAQAFRWRKRGATGWLQAVQMVSRISLDDLQHIERQKEIIDRNTRHFLQKKPARAE